MGFLKRLLGLEPHLVKLLSARIVTDEDHRYYVTFTRHHPQLKEPEFVRLVLHYYAKTLYNFDPSEPDGAKSAFVLRGMMDSAVAGGIQRESGILRAAEIDDVVAIVASPPRNRPRQIVATLYFADAMQRHITTEFPPDTYLQHMAFSVMILLQATLDEIGDEWIECLDRSLAKMNEAYDSGQSYSEIQNLSAVPNMAFLSAMTR